MPVLTHPKIEKWLTRAENFYRDNQHWLEKDLIVKILRSLYRVAIVLAVLGLILQFLYMAGIAYQMKRPRTIVVSLKADAAQAISVAAGTTFLNDNQWYPYGPVYYRLAHLVSLFLPENVLLASDSDRRDEKNHFALMLVSWFALFSLALLLAHMITGNLLAKLAVALAINSIFLSNQVWVFETLVSCHPDITLCFFTGVAIYFLGQWILRPESDRNLVWGAAMGGAALSTKLSILPLFPSLVVLFFPPFTKNRIARFFKFLLWVLGFYFLVGFPQNFNVLGLYETVFVVKGDYKMPVTLETIFLWLKVYWELGASLIFFIVLCVLIQSYSSGENSPEQKRKAYFLLASGFLGLITLSFVSYAEQYTHRYYALPFLTWLSGALIYAGRAMGEPSKSDYSRRFSNIRKMLLVFVAGSFLAVNGVIPSSTQTRVADFLEHSRDTQNLYSMVNKKLLDGEKIIHDPYVPVPLEYWSNDHVIRESTVSNHFNQGNASSLVFSYGWYHRFLSEEPTESDRIGMGMQEWNAMHNFYTLFQNRNTITDSRGRTWTKSYQDSQKNEIWDLTE